MESFCWERATPVAHHELERHWSGALPAKKAVMGRRSGWALLSIGRVLSVRFDPLACDLPRPTAADLTVVPDVERLLLALLRHGVGIGARQRHNSLCGEGFELGDCTCSSIHSPALEVRFVV